MRLNLYNAEFIKSVSDIEGVITDPLPKIVFAGKSNVGKSSTINALLNRKSLARVSVSPGKTIYMNYYLIDRKLYLVDLPGYGFAKASRKLKRSWGKLMDDFFANARDITLCVLIVDARHAPSAEDRMMCDYLKQTGIPFILAANKTDAVKKSEVDRRLREIALSLELGEEVLPVPYSARTKAGVDKLRNILFNLSSENTAY